MKKILSLILIIFFSVQICMADESNNASNPNKEVSNISNVSNVNDANIENEENIDSYFSEDPRETTQLDGYLEYNQNAEDSENEQNAVFLDPTKATGINLTQPKSLGSKSLISNSKKPSFQPIKDDLEAASKFSTQEYDINPVSTSYSKKFGKFSLGTSYNSSMSSARANYSTGIFTKYEGKHFALNGGYSKKTNSNYDSFNDTFSFAPELKITKRLSLLDVMQTDLMQINKSNEVVLRYTPHFKKYAEEVQLELGAGQSFYQDTYINSSVRFSTRFKI